MSEYLDTMHNSCRDLRYVSEHIPELSDAIRQLIEETP